MTAKTILILGGGVGGIVAANALRRQLAAPHRIIVVDRRGEYVFTPSLLWVMVGQRRPDQISKDLRRLLRPGVEVVRAEVEAIEPEQGRIRAGDRELAYDYLVVALGAELAPAAMPGYGEAAHNFFAPEGAAGLWQALARFEGGRAVVLVSSLPYKCPAAPYEAAMLLAEALRRRRLQRGSRVEVFTPEPLPMPVAGPAMGEAVVQMMSARGIAFHAKRQVQRLDAEAREPNGNRIVLERDGHARLVIQDLCIADPEGRMLLQHLDLEIRRGERVLVAGDPAVTSSLFKVMGGLWPWGSGRVLLPADGNMQFMPQRPFLPEGTLRQALCYPRPSNAFGDAAVARALECSNSSWLAPRLDEHDNWEQALPLRAQQRLGRRARLERHPQLAHPHVDRADRQGRQRGARARQAVDHLVDRAVAAGRHDHVVALLGRLARDPRAVARSGRRLDVNLPAVLAPKIARRANVLLEAGGLARDRVEDDQGADRLAGDVLHAGEYTTTRPS